MLESAERKVERIEVVPLYKDTALYYVSDVVHEGRVRHQKLTQEVDQGHSAALCRKSEIGVSRAQEKANWGRSFVQRHCYVRRERRSPRRMSSSPKTLTPGCGPLRPTVERKSDIGVSRAQEEADRVRVVPFFKDTALYCVRAVIHEGRVRYQKLTQGGDEGHSAALWKERAILE